MDKELLDIFTDRLAKDLIIMSHELSYLTTNRTEATATLFRIFHNHKATSSYLNLPELHALTSKGENILNALRSNEEDISGHAKKWLQSSVVQLQIWYEQLVTNTPLSPVDTSLFPDISLLDNSAQTSEIMQDLTLLYADMNLSRAKAIQAPLKHIFKHVSITTSLEELKSAVRENNFDIIIINLQKQSIETGIELLKIRPDIALITAIPNLRPSQNSRLFLRGLTHPIPSPIKSKDLKRQLHNIVTSHFSKVHTIISHDKICAFIHKLDPLSSSLKKITQLCDDPESSIKEIINIVKSDALTTATILHAANSPLYAVESTSSIDQAVTAFGKRLIKAISLSELSLKLGSLELEAYEINENQFKRASALRLALMNAWYGNINAQDLSILSTSAILGNLGEILIDQEIVKSGLTSHFKYYREKGFTTAEVALMKTSASFITADILEYWGLNAELIDAIRYSDNPFNAPTKRIQSLACANAVVYKMVTSKGELLTHIPKNVKSLLRKTGLQETQLEEAVKQIEGF